VNISTTVTTPSPRTWSATALLASFVASAVLALVVSGPAGATTRQAEDQGLTNLNDARSQAQGQRNSLTREIGALEGSEEEVTAELTALTNQLDVQRAALEDAKWVAIVAAAAATEAAEVAAEARIEAEETEVRVRQMAIDAYIHPPAEDLAAVLMSKSIEEASRRRSVLSVRAEQQADLLDERRDALVKLEVTERESAGAKADADEAQSEQESATLQLQASHDQQRNFQAALEARLEASLAEVAALSSLDAKLAGQIRDRELQLQAAAAAALGPAPEESGPPPPPAPVPATVAPTPTIPRPTPPPVTIPSTVNTVKVGVFWVNEAIAPQTQALLNAAEAAGIVLGGGAFRDPASQIALRQAHCGPTYYDIYQKPASQCSPPTARPGSSMHEVGLAFDFTCDGSLISTRASICFVWLELNAATFGLYNLPSEPWHWSINGH
jgi:hypothetical protein